MSSPTNMQTVNSPEHFQQLLSADLERISVLYFYADWAEPCAAMTQAIQALAEAHPAVLFLVVEAEALPEISESFEVDAVPYTILLKVCSQSTIQANPDNRYQGHTLLGRVSGAQAKQLSDEITKHTSPAGASKAGMYLYTYQQRPLLTIHAAQPQSNSTQKPEAAPTSYAPPTEPSNGTSMPVDPLEESHEQLVARCHEIMKQVSLKSSRRRTFLTIPSTATSHAIHEGQP
jgi:thiol-disulfide isomerase/thioredoxin